MTSPPREVLETALGYGFQRTVHLEVALTHRSTGEPSNNETLEFLGDAVLALAMSDLLMSQFPTAREGALSKMRAALVNAEVLARKARMLGLGTHLRLGKGEERSGGREKNSILAAAYEAVLGAVYLDAGYDAARTIVATHFAGDVDGQSASVGVRDFKTELQEMTQRLFRETPVYSLVEESGPDHAKTFVLDLRIGGRSYARGEGRSKKAAEQVAAELALAQLRREHPETGA